ncbi:MAG TPA: hypothetical protein VN310_16360 [Candidatus Dormibacteraeota bacterium]|jgi:hypothetical protein|nr:hypothetical protein [Candidatus Dormibacteraeota bacterium]
MALTVVYLIGLAIVRGIASALRRLRVRRPRGLCAGCQFVHMQYGATGRNAVFCTFGAVVRPVRLDVLYCTDYRDRNAGARPTRIGFVPGINVAEGG